MGSSRHHEEAAVTVVWAKTVAADLGSDGRDPGMRVLGGSRIR